MTEDGTAPAAQIAPDEVGKSRRLSRILAELASDESRERISIGDLLDVFGNRAFGAMIFIFAAPNAIPVAMPGVSALLGAPLLFLTWQLMRGWGEPWFPAAIRNRSFARTDFRRGTDIIVPWLQRVERMIRPRVAAITSARAERIIGLVGLLLAIMIFLPIPFGNVLPGFALALLALGVLERDGFAVIIGAVSALVSFVLVSGVIYTLAKAAAFIVSRAFA